MIDKDGDFIMRDEEEVKEPAPRNNVIKLFTPKPFTNHSVSKLAQISQYIEVTILELYQKVMNEKQAGQRKAGDEENCRICLCELYENLEITPLLKL